MYELYTDFTNFCTMFAESIGYDGLVYIYSFAAFVLIVSAIIAHVEEYEIRSIFLIFLLFCISFWMLIIAMLLGKNITFYAVILILSFITSFLQIEAL